MNTTAIPMATPEIDVDIEKLREDDADTAHLAGHVGEGDD